MIDNEHAGFAVCVPFIHPINLALGELGVGYAVGRFEIIVEFVEEIGDCFFVGSIVCRLLASIVQSYGANTHQ